MVAFGLQARAVDTERIALMQRVHIVLGWAEHPCFIRLTANGLLAGG
jgi:hypothetical protein